MVSIFEYFVWYIVRHQQFQPVEQLRGGRLLLQAGNGAHIEKDFHSFLHQRLGDIGVVHTNNLAHGVAVGEIDEVKETAAQESVGQFFFVITGDNNNGAVLRLDGFAGLIDKKLHAIQLYQQVIGEFDIGLVHLVNQQHHLLVGIEGFPQLAALDVVGNVMDFVTTELGIPQPRDRVVLVEALLGLGGRFDMPLDEALAQAQCHLLRQHGFTGTWLALDQ